MGQKVNPRGMRIGIIDSWRSRWFAPRTMPGSVAKFIGEDIKIREYVKSKLASAGISRIEIERAAARVKINIFSAKPGLVIGKKGKDIEDLRKQLRNLVGIDISLNIIETKKPH